MSLLATHFSLNWVYTKCVLDYFNQTASLPCRQYFIGTEPQLKSLFGLENLVNLSNQLHRKLFLSHIVIRLDYHFNQPPCLQVTERWLFSHSLILLAGCLAKYYPRLWRGWLIIVENQVPTLILLELNILQHLLFLLFSLLLNKVKIHFYLPIAVVILDNLLTIRSLPDILTHPHLLFFFLFLIPSLPCCIPVAVSWGLFSYRGWHLVESVREHTPACQVRVADVDLAVGFQKV